MLKSTHTLALCQRFSFRGIYSIYFKPQLHPFGYFYRQKLKSHWHDWLTYFAHDISVKYLIYLVYKFNLHFRTTTCSWLFNQNIEPTIDWLAAYGKDMRRKSMPFIRYPYSQPSLKCISLRQCFTNFLSRRYDLSRQIGENCLIPLGSHGGRKFNWVRNLGLPRIYTLLNF